MHVLIAMDSFKGSLTSLQAGNAVREGILQVIPHGEIRVCPMADGGEGTVDALGTQGQLQQVTVTGPLGQPVTASYAILENDTAVMEMAAAAGLLLVPPESRNPMHTTTLGVGEMILHAIEKGCRRFVIGIGGSATNDGGIGMLTALGFRFLDAAGRPVPPTAYGLSQLASVDRTHACPALSQCTFRIACDVTNPLCGDLGCSAVYGPQKGADPQQISQMDNWLLQYAGLTGGDPNVPGTGAAGGLGYGFLYYLRATLEPGVQIILSETGMEEKIRKADFVVTGEGRLDGQSLMGKAPVGIAQLAMKLGKPVIAFAGSLGENVENCRTYGICDAYGITPEGMPLAQAMDPVQAYENLKNTARNVFGQKAEEWI